MAVVPGIRLEHARTTATYQGDAVVDTGAEAVLVPHGIPGKHAWPEGETEPLRLRTFSGIVDLPGYLVTLVLGSARIPLRAYELPEDAPLQGFVLGTSAMQTMVVCLDGPRSMLSIQT